ncbi:hypothetical protein QFZ96_005808 [Paraburkholderia youngii]
MDTSAWYTALLALRSAALKSVTGRLILTLRR